MALLVLSLSALVLFAGSFILFFSFLVSKQILAAVISIEAMTVMVIMILLSFSQSADFSWAVFLLCAIATIGAAAGLSFVVKMIKFSDSGYVL